MNGMRWIAVVSCALAGCSDVGAPSSFAVDESGGTTSDEATAEGSSTGDAPLQPDPDPFLEQYALIQAEAAMMDPGDLVTHYPGPPEIDALSYDPQDAVGLDAITQVYPLDPEQSELLTTNGFVALTSTALHTFENGYHDVYDADLPVLVTTDSILYALHRSFDSILARLEQEALVPELDALLAGVHVQLGDPVPDELAAANEDLDVVVTVARSLLGGAPIAAATGPAADERVATILADAQALGVGRVALFGSELDYDYSQLEPRGHYTDDPALQQYFRAMMWLGRTEARLVEYDDGVPLFRRAAADAVFLFDRAMRKSDGAARWERIEHVLTTLIGDSDNMTPRDGAKVVETLGADDLDDWAALSDDKIYEELVLGDYGIQRIMSQIMYTDPTDPPLVLPRSWLVLGQRFTIDSYVFHNVTYDRVQDLRTGTKVTRMLPSELDVQFVLGNDLAAEMLQPELERYGYQGILHELRFLVDAHPQEFWDASFYAGWIDGLRSLNASDEESAAYPEPMRTKAWKTKTLHTQAASRAELRHDTLLYAKQSYSGGIGCMYPDGYVEPAVAFYGRMAHLGELGATMVGEIEAAGYEMEGVGDYFVGWTQTMNVLRGIAQKELAGEMLTADEISFLGQVVEIEEVGCGELSYDGWYPALFFDEADVGQPEPTIADVHTAPTDDQGVERGWVVHTGTGAPMLMVMTVPACDGSGSSAYVGPISSWYDVLTENYERLTDEEWAQQKGDAARPEWIDAFAK
jgi:hypothetical protein